MRFAKGCNVRLSTVAWTTGYANVTPQLPAAVICGTDVSPRAWTYLSRNIWSADHRSQGHIGRPLCAICNGIRPYWVALLHMKAHRGDASLRAAVVQGRLTDRTWQVAGVCHKVWRVSWHGMAYTLLAPPLYTLGPERGFP